MASYELARKKVRLWEGGWSPGFPGSGETYRGLDRIYNPKWAGWKILDKIPNKKQGQFFNNPELERLVEDYHLNQYWKPSRAQEISNTDLATFFFDFYFHKPLQSTAAASLAAKELSPSIIVQTGKITQDVINVMNKFPAEVYKRMYGLRELHYKNKWMNQNGIVYKTSQKGVLNRLYSFAETIGTGAKDLPEEKKKPRNTDTSGKHWYTVDGISGNSPFS